MFRGSPRRILPGRLPAFLWTSWAGADHTFTYGAAHRAISSNGSSGWVCWREFFLSTPSGLFPAGCWKRITHLSRARPHSREALSALRAPRAAAVRERGPPRGSLHRRCERRAPLRAAAAVGLIFLRRGA